MNFGEFYSDFIEKFESLFQEAISDLSGDTKSIDARVTSSFFEPLQEYMRGGKRIRPYLIAIGADNLEDKILRAGVAFEMLHNSILIHDDIMDGASTRRGTDTVHVAFRKFTAHGESGAMLLGDYLATFANEYMAKHVETLQDKFFEMQKLLYVGQYFEMLHWGTRGDLVLSEKIEYFKSAQYTFEYPLQMGLLLTDRDIHMLDAFSRAVGLAFQMRDDFLDVSDLESGKDKGLDLENGVPNTVQILLAQNSGDVEAVREEVKKRLSRYEAEAREELEKADISVRQKEALTRVLEFCVSV